MKIIVIFLLQSEQVIRHIEETVGTLANLMERRAVVRNSPPVHRGKHVGPSPRCQLALQVLHVLVRVNPLLVLPQGVHTVKRVHPMSH